MPWQGAQELDHTLALQLTEPVTLRFCNILNILRVYIQIDVN